jgi:malate dehydrogenase
LLFERPLGTMARMKVTIVGGSGGVGSSTAFNLLRQAEGHEVVVVDRRPEMVTSHVMDLEQNLLLGSTGTIRAGDDDDLHDADVVVLAASAPLTVNTSRLVYLDDNAVIVGRVLDVLAIDWPGILLVVTNPVDALVTWAHARTGIDRRRVLGYTVNDSLRIRTGVARELGIEPSRVEAWVLGEHGEACVPLWDRIRVDGRPIDLTAPQRADAEAFLRTWYVRHVALDSGRSSTWTSGLGIARMISAIARDDGEPWPASVLLRGEYGIDGTALSVPVTLGPGGARAILDWPLTPSQDAALRRAAGIVARVTASIGAGSGAGRSGAGR